MAERAAQERRQDDKDEQRRAIVGDEDGHWLITQVERLWHVEHVFRTGHRRCFSFLVEGGTAFIGQPEGSDAVVTMDMPAGSIVRKVDGTDLGSWVFRVDNGYSGVDRSYFDVAYREISTGDHLLYLMGRGPSDGTVAQG